MFLLCAPPLFNISRSFWNGWGTNQNMIFFKIMFWFVPHPFQNFWICLWYVKTHFCFGQSWLCCSVFLQLLSFEKHQVFFHKLLNIVWLRCFVNYHSKSQSQKKLYIFCIIWILTTFPTFLTNCCSRILSRFQATSRQGRENACNSPSCIWDTCPSH